jgi:hypothetical protein
MLGMNGKMLEHFRFLLQILHERFRMIVLI